MRAEPPWTGPADPTWPDPAGLPRPDPAHPAAPPGAVPQALASGTAGARTEPGRWRRWRDRLLLQEDLNFLLTNRVPRIALTHAMGWLSRQRAPWIVKPALFVWRACTELELEDAATTRFDSLHACFTRALRPGTRPADPRPEVLLSPCDGLVGAHGPVQAGQVWQAKGFPYSVAELFGDPRRAAAYEGGQFVTLRLTSAMYHRFHAPADARLAHVTYLSGDTWNVNPIALKRVRRLFCRNERAALHLRLADGQPMAVVAVAAILVASIRLHALDVRLHLRWRGPHEWTCDAPLARGQEMGWFEHGSTLIVFVPAGWRLAQGLVEGSRLRVGQALWEPAPDTDVAGLTPHGHGAVIAGAQHPGA